MKTKKEIILGIVLMILLVFICWGQLPGSTPVIKDDNGVIIPNSIASLEKVELGDMEQWLQIRGNDSSNPILLWLHGGPGSAQMPVARYYNGELEKEFIVVQWDQRGAGKSNPQNFDEQMMTFEQYVNDAHQLTQFLQKRFDKEKIYLVGHSWGSQIGITLTSVYPEDYYAYVGVSQVVNPLLSHETAYRWLENEIKEKGNEKDLKKLKELSSPPFTNHREYVKFAGMVSAYGGGMDVGMAELLRISLSAPEYRFSDFLAWIDGANRGSGPMWESTLSFDSNREVPQLLVPVYFFCGKKDFNTPAELVAAYYQKLDAPKGKQLIYFENSAHTPFMAEPERFNQEMIRIKFAHE